MMRRHARDLMLLAAVGLGFVLGLAATGNGPLIDLSDHSTATTTYQPRPHAKP